MLLKLEKTVHKRRNENLGFQLDVGSPVSSLLWETGSNII